MAVINTRDVMTSMDVNLVIGIVIALLAVSKDVPMARVTDGQESVHRVKTDSGETNVNSSVAVTVQHLVFS